jgi:preprotein translocase subunit SecF
MSDNSMSSETVSLGDWILTMILSSIPIVGLIMILVWAFGGGAKPSKKNYARALIIMAIIGIVLGIISSILFAGAFAALANNLSSSYSY